jgi:subtilase family serine protease
VGHLPYVAVCGIPAPGGARCHAEVITTTSGQPLTTVSYTSGYAPADLAAAYGFPAVSGGTWSWNGQTVALVDAYQNPDVASDLAAYRAQFNLPPCTVASGCFTELNESGAASPLPSGNTGWGQETDLDVEMVSAVCPECKILLLAANSASLTDLGTAVNTAAAKGANAISNSYGTGQFSGETTDANAYYNNHPGVAVTVSNGDGGYGVEFPADAHNVTAVGGTSLTRSSTARGWSETVWSGTGSGCSAYVAQPSWQTAVAPSGCADRIVGDVSAVADPNTGVAVYDSYGSSGGANWYVFGGTSVSSPIIASFYALANAAGINTGATYPSQTPYQHAGALNDVTSGSNGTCTRRHGHDTSGAAFLCTGEVGYDAPTGMGTPQGLGAF